jgi:preprotein translocase subunit SecB
MFQVEKIYTKDVSFENPKAPQVFSAQGQPKIEIGLNVGHQQVGDDHWEVSLKINVVARNNQDDDVLFEVEVEQAGIFLIRNIPEERMATLLSVDCPTIIFPYTRQIISQLVGDGGFMPLILEPVNFVAAYQNSQEQAQKTVN